ncbi:MAG TPA: hypothetical protein VG318_06995 [Actinomycetota bacterium]|nr:hypothetical protein [Actinomycetota bacterium]
MNDDVRQLFESTTSGIHVPEGDLASVLAGGLKRRRTSIVAGAAASLAAVAAIGWIAGAALNAGPDAPRPVAPDLAGRDFTSLVPDETIGPEPGRVLARPEDIAEARAVTVAFHALVLRVPYYGFAYEGVDGGDGEWRVTFVEGAERSAIERGIENRAEVAAQAEATLAARRARLALLRSRLKAKARTVGPRKADEAARKKAELRELLERTMAELERLHGEIRGAQRQIERQEAEGGPFPVVLVVEESDGGLAVTAVETNSPRRPQLEAAVGYAEPVDGVDAWGADYFGLELGRLGADEGLSVQMNVFWTGPIPAQYEERCVPEIRDATNEVVWRGDEGRLLYNPTPSSEERREWAVSFGADYDGPLEGLRLEMECSWRPSY